MAWFPQRRLSAGIFVAVVGVGLFVGGACKKDDPAAPGAAASGASTKDLALLPVDSELVLGLNVAQAQQSALFREFVLPQLQQNEDFQRLSELMKSKCSIDPMTAVSSISVGMKNITSGAPDGVMVFHGVDKAKGLACVDKLKDELAKEQVTVTKDGEVLLIKGESPEETSALTFVGDSTAIAVVGSKATKEGVLEVAQGKSTLSSSPQFVDMYGRIKTSHTIWMLLNGATEPLASGLAKLNVKSKAIFGSIDIGSGISVDMRMRVESEEQASNLAGMIQSQAALVSAMVDKLEIGNDKADVRLQMSATAEKLKGMVTTLGGLLGGGRRGLSLP